MAELARDRRRWCWKGSETAELARGSGMEELARKRRISSGVRRRRISSAARRRRRWPGLKDGGVGQSSETVELFRSSEMAKLAGAPDGGTGQGSETAELERARKRWS